MIANRNFEELQTWMQDQFEQENYDLECYYKALLVLVNVQGILRLITCTLWGAYLPLLVCGCQVIALLFAIAGMNLVIVLLAAIRRSWYSDVSSLYRVRVTPLSRRNEPC